MWIIAGIILGDEIEARRKREAIELCGKNRGPHDYVPIEWKTSGDFKRVTRMLCRICFCNVTTETLLLMYREVSHSP